MKIYSGMSCLIVVPMLNLVPRHEDVSGSGGMAPHFLTLGMLLRKRLNNTLL